MKVMQPGGVTLDINDVDRFVNKWRPIDGWLIADHSGFVVGMRVGIIWQQTRCFEELTYNN